MKKIIFLLILFFIFNCSSINEPNEEIRILEVKTELERYNDYYELILDRNNNQTFCKITVVINEKEKPVKIKWNADSEWIYNHFGYDYSVPLINKNSYSDNGIGNTIFAPVIDILGDTVAVTATVLNNSETINIILK